MIETVEPSKLPAIVDPSPHEIFDLADESQIIAEIQGRVTDKFVYELKGVKDPESGQNVVGLSYAGTNWACREYAKQGEVIRIIRDSISYQIDPINPEYIIVTVMAQRFSVNPETGREIALDTNPGCKRQWIKMKKNIWENGQKVGEQIVEDPFHYEKALSKATRNSKQGLIPTDIVKKLIQQALKVKKTGPVESAPKAQPARERPGRPQTAPRPPQKEAVQQTSTNPPSGGGGVPHTAAPKGAPVSKETLIQRFSIVLKAAFKTQDDAQARAAMKKICGIDRIADLPEEDLRKIGKILQGIPKGLYVIAEDGTHVLDKKTGEAVWGKPPEQPEPTVEAPTQDTELF